MRTFPRSTVLLGSMAAFALGTLAAGSASAQPNPFDDYERYAAGKPLAIVTPVAPGPVIRTGPMTWSLGMRSQLSFSRLTYERGGGANDGTATALLFRLSPALQLFVYDRVEVGISPGLMVRAGGNNVGDDASDANMLIEATGHYFAPLSPRFSLVPGLGIGGYFGSGTRKMGVTVPNGPTLRGDRDTRTSGLALSLYLGIAYQLDDRVQLRSGLTANAFFGWDSVEGHSSSLHNSATHIGIPIELFYSF